MERIKQAMERARAGQPPTAAAAAVPAGGEDQPDWQGHAITYTQTRVVPMDPAVLQRHRILCGHDSEEVLTAYKMLRTQVLQRMVANDWKALAVTSPGPGAGKSVTAANLALSLAREVAHTVLLVDLDLRRPSLHRYMGLAPQHGIGDFLLQDQPLSAVLLNPGVERLVVLPGKNAVYNSSEMLRSPRMVRLVEELKSRYPSRLVVFDLPPLLAGDDAVTFTPYADAALLVLEEGVSTREQLRASRELLADTPLIGTVLNKSDERLNTYGY